jgi:hypothetical protein
VAVQGTRVSIPVADDIGIQRASLKNNQSELLQLANRIVAAGYLICACGRAQQQLGRRTCHFEVSSCAFGVTHQTHINMCIDVRCLQFVTNLGTVE